MNDEAKRELVHGSCIAFGDYAALIIGASGAGKSANALTLISMGAELIADDQVVLENINGALHASCPDGYSGMIEARGIGILKVPARDTAQVRLIVDLDQTELHRLPTDRKYEMLGVSIDLIFGRENWHLAAGIAAILKGSRLR